MLLSCPSQRHPSIGEPGRLFHNAPSVFDGQMPVDRSRCARSIWFIQAPTLPTRSTATFAPSRTYIRPATSPPSAISSPMPQRPPQEAPRQQPRRALRVAGAPRWVCSRRMPSRHAARVRSMAGTPIISPASSSWGVTSRSSACAMRRSSDGFSLATTWKRYVPAAAGKRVPRGLSGEAWTPRVGDSIIGILVVAEKHCCAMQ